MDKWWISCKHATGQVNCEHGRIVFAPPVWQKFMGQHITRLTGWLKARFGPTEWVRL